MSYIEINATPTPDTKVPMIKACKELSGLSLKEAKDIVDRLMVTDMPLNIVMNEDESVRARGITNWKQYGGSAVVVGDGPVSMLRAAAAKALEQQKDQLAADIIAVILGNSASPSSEADR